MPATRAATSPGPASAAAAGTDPTCDQVMTLGELEKISGLGGWALTSSDDVLPTRRPD